MIEGGATEEEVAVVPYLDNTMTVEPWSNHDYNESLRDLTDGVYYVVSPKVELNRFAKEVNAACFWQIDNEALNKSDFGMHNVKMATFIHVFFDECRRVSIDLGSGHCEMKVRFGFFPEDDYPLILLGPMTQSNMKYYLRPLQVLPHGWIHLLFWDGCCTDSDDENTPKNTCEAPAKLDNAVDT